MNNKSGIIITRLVGVSDEDTQNTIKVYGYFDEFNPYILAREPENELDKNAIAVYANADYEVRFLGYVPRGIAKEVAPLMDEGTPCCCYFAKLNKSKNSDNVGITVAIFIGEV